VSRCDEGGRRPATPWLTCEVGLDANGRTLMLVLAARSATNIGSARRQTRLVEPRLRQ
jgi:hypothetical protein